MRKARIPQHEFLASAHAHQNWIDKKKDGDRLYWVAAEFPGLDLCGQNLSWAVFRDCIFKDCNMYAASFTGAQFIDCQFKACDMGRACFNAATFLNGNMTRCDMNHIDARGANISRFHFTNCKMRYAWFVQATLVEVEMGLSDIGFANFAAAVLHGTDVKAAQNYGCATFEHNPGLNA